MKRVIKSERRNFIKKSALLGGGVVASLPSFPFVPSLLGMNQTVWEFKISLAQWSFHRALKAGTLKHLDFAPKAKKDFGISAVEYVREFFKDKGEDKDYISQMGRIAEDAGVENLLIMIDGEGNLGDAEKRKRNRAVKNHYKWVKAAKQLGCHSIRVNAAGSGSAEEVQKAALDGLSRLSEFAKDYEINIVVENHGGYSSNGKWLSELIRSVQMDNCGTLPDFGNFCIEGNAYGNSADGECVKEYDRYLGMEELLPFAKGVSAKSYDFDEQGNEVGIDFKRILSLVKESGYSGYIGIEYEGAKMSEEDGVRATKRLLESLGGQV